ncbi:glycoside hydrolase family 5 protein [Ephemerocybe angulata]|uniref:mannan endo-1,4-beta-mannosidase n=1 Tax=Ephemerocybe angulata TaxID=980116 RepID=A0A8H6MDE3_9AGAR|nr:glycoside hydrolase family 5 protein [Tulosesus angulatus]
MYVAALWPAVLGACVASTLALKPPARTRVDFSKRAPEGPQFVSTDNGKFVVNGAPLNFVGTNAYWLPALNSDADVNKTLADIAASGIKVVRTWAFNDVTEIPATGTWFAQVGKDGELTINDGPNGLQKLDTVVKLAEENGLYLQLALTNNWNPSETTISKRNNDGSKPRNALSNDYGGMDVYVRQFGLQHHNEFYTNPALIEAFKKYTTAIVKRYTTSPAIFGWELANDPRCNSTLPAAQCNPQDITRWHDTVAEHIRTIDTNHLVAAGHGGYLCVDCEKIHPRAPTVPPAQVSATPGRRRSVPQFLTKKELLRSRSETRKARRKANLDTNARRGIRGRWAPTPTRRQEDFQAVGPAYDGTYGVDSEDLLNSPNLDYGSFQLFPDQNKYGADDPNLSAFDNTVAQGNEWIRQHGSLGQDFGKPITLNAFGLVTQQNAPYFQPFNGSPPPTTAPSGPDGTGTQQPYGVTNAQRDSAYSSWIGTANDAGLKNVVQYQWGQPELSVAPGTPVSVATDTTGVTTTQGTTGVSPNDGYSTNGAGKEEVVEVLKEGIQAFGSDANLRR